MPKVSASIKRDHYRVEINSPTGNQVIADEPLANGGKDTGFSPKELLAAALSACTSATLRMYMDRKGWEATEIKVETEIAQIDGKSLFTRRLEFSDSLDEDKRTRLIQVANACPVHKVLSNPIEFKTEIA